MLLLISACAIFFTWFYLNFKKSFGHWRDLGVKHVKPSFPFGSLTKNTFALRSVADIVDDHYKKFKNDRYFGMYLFSTPLLVVKDLELIKKITVKDFDHFLNHSNCANEEIDKLWSKNLFAMIDEPWRKMRATLSPAFTGNKMRYMFPLINIAAENMIKSLKSKNGLVKANMTETFAKATNDAIASCGLGIHCNSFEDPNNDFLRIGAKGVDFSGLKRLKFLLYSSLPKFMKFFGIKMFVQEFADFFHSVINQTIKNREETGIERPDVINLLLKARKGQSLMDDESSENHLIFKEYLTNEYITAQAAIFYFGGFDTTATLLSFLAYNLVANPDIQERLFNDVQKAAQENDGKLSYDIIKNIKYLNNVFIETLRLYSQATVLDRVCNTEYTIDPVNPSEKPLVLKPGQTIWIPVYSIHRDDTHFDNPFDFNPDRELNPNSLNLGFGNGPRFCIGQRFAAIQIKNIICHLLLNFQMVPIEETQIPLKISITDIGIKPEKNIWIGLKSRE